MLFSSIQLSRPAASSASFSVAPLKSRAAHLLCADAAATVPLAHLFGCLGLLSAGRLGPTGMSGCARGAAAVGGRDAWGALLAANTRLPPGLASSLSRLFKASTLFAMSAESLPSLIDFGVSRPLSLSEASAACAWLVMPFFSPRTPLRLDWAAAFSKLLSVLEKISSHSLRAALNSRRALSGRLAALDVPEATALLEERASLRTKEAKRSVKSERTVSRSSSM